jgi:hypothetical protein
MIPSEHRQASSGACSREPCARWWRTRVLHKFIVAVGMVGILSVSPAEADCQIGDAKLEEAILQKPGFDAPANRQNIHHLRTLRDAALILWSYGRHDDCERLVANIRELIAAPPIPNLENNDANTEKQIGARRPKTQRGGAVVGRRGETVRNR